MDAGAISRTQGLSDQLRHAASKGQLDQVISCLQAGATLDTDQDGRTALHYAALNGFPDVTRFLIEKGCNKDIQDDSGYTPLHRAASQGHIEVITILLESGCDLNAQDEHGNAAIHEAAWNGFSKTLELLVKYEVDVSLVNKAGFTALHLSAQNGHNESTRVLLYAGCNSDLKNNYGDTTLHTAARYGHAGVTRILISARTKLNEQNKNGDTALHIASALKRRKIAKLLVDSGIDVTVRNKQNETAMDVARRKDHEEIVAIIQAHSRPVKQPLKEVNFRLEPSNQMVPMTTTDVKDEKPENKDKGRRFLFFKKKSKSKDKATVGRTGGVSPGMAVSTTDIPMSSTRPVQGFFSKYVPRQGVQYYRDLAGNVKTGPVGYTPTCNCLPAINRLQKEVYDTQDHVYGSIQSNTRAMHERINQVDQRSSMRVRELEKYTQDRFIEEEHMCRQRINQQVDEYGNVHSNNVKTQIQTWLEQKLEGYGHCLHHHHDDSALPNENIFSDVHETANGRLFKSRSDETLSQSDNHSGKYRKREFYESRQQAMQQIRAWQVPSYSKDRNRIKVVDKQPNRNHEPPLRSQNQNQAASNTQINSNPIRQYPMEPQVEVKYFDNKNTPKSIGRNAPRQGDNNYMTMTGSQNNYMTMNGSQPQSQVPQAQARPQVYQSVRQTANSRGPVNHSTPKSRDSSPYTTHQGIVRSQTDGGLSASSPRQLMFQDSPHAKQTSSSSQCIQTYTAVDSSSEMKNARSAVQLNSSPMKLVSSASANVVSTGLRNSLGSDKFMPETPKPTFTTFGYDDSADVGSGLINNSDKADKSAPVPMEVSASLTPRSNSSHSSQDGQNKTQLTDKSRFARQNSHNSYGFSPSFHDDMYVEMKNITPRLHTRTRSSEGLLETDIDHDSQAAEQSVLQRESASQQVTARSSSETRASVRSPTNSVPAPQFPSRSVSSSISNSKFAMLISSPHQPIPVSGGRPVPTDRPVPPPKPSAQASIYPYAKIGDVKRGNERMNDGNIQLKTFPQPVSDSQYSTVKDARYQRDANQNFTVKADVHSSVPYYAYSAANGSSGVINPNQLEPRSKTAYQTYLTESPQFMSEIHRESPPNICNNSKEDSSSNPDSGYSSKIYGNRVGSVQPASCGSTPSSSFSTERGLTSNTNSPQSQYSSTDYDYLPHRQYEDEVQSHNNTWYQRKLQETTQKVYDSWKNDRTPGKMPQSGRGVGQTRAYGNGDLMVSNQMQTSRPSQMGYTPPVQQNHMVSTFVVHGSDV
ncbi:uncharacterized protein LOC127853920 isoform X2 [Dreissena polymorpha]|nr:uncharacterized protein LOC127853920 isoform X2 [Dreissena polymorpha]XP_052244712.1 uncharacterized protein LOC127853920 isoform X2 [Dreissena polymorpha]XP_052244713.1 uncharacterized protein LOC127853920 isoform X2 [Dreissena polymorpha]XP_052244715.1 uncharacterized protein LOC127853920 isoform X2 [Dreissena polymorpha]XP_052244716.1 uncharacterized protein LOC127853920 isoform X2 [Dreissena polymorpha]XP_052244717.1 uncharacterized protein LOC127853920 isoform X2 [Dreissena polymorpha]